tara:strand:- start:78 stop:245 length:168 start_codon:yes stop_codon:yes gene_type:complete
LCDSGISVEEGYGCVGCGGKYAPLVIRRIIKNIKKKTQINQKTETAKNTKHGHLV